MDSLRAAEMSSPVSVTTFAGGGHVRFLAEPLAELFCVRHGEAALSFDGHAAFGPALSGRCSKCPGNRRAFEGLRLFFLLSALGCLGHGGSFYSVARFHPAF